MTQNTLVADDTTNIHNLVQEPLETETLSIGGIRLDRKAHTVTAFGRPASLTPAEFDLLHALMIDPGRAFSRSELLLELQDIDSEFENAERTIDVHIRNLRTKIEPAASKPIYIKTVFGVGYRFSQS